MGTDKTAAALGTTTVLDHLLDHLPDGWPVVAVGPERPTHRRVRWTRETPTGAGPVAAVAAGLPLVDTDLVVLLAGDMPFAATAASDRTADRSAPVMTSARRASTFVWGDAVWEWTASAFAPYPGFVADRYREYSAPWFGSHRSVRGASFATDARLVDARYRNFYTPDRDDLFIGFRTCGR